MGKLIYTCWRRQWHPTPVLLPGKSHGRRSLVGCSPWGHWGLDTTERLHFHFSLSCIGEGNGNPLQSSCLENPRDRGAWWAAVYGVAESRTRLMWLSSSSSSVNRQFIRFCGWITGYCTGVPHFVHSFIHQLMSNWVVSNLGRLGIMMCEHSHMCFYGGLSFHFSWTDSCKWNCWVVC